MFPVCFVFLRKCCGRREAKGDNRCEGGLLAGLRAARGRIQGDNTIGPLTGEELASCEAHYYLRDSCFRRTNDVLALRLGTT